MSTAAGPTTEKISGAECGCSSREGPHAATAVPVAHALHFSGAVCRRAAVEASVDRKGAAHERGYTWLPLCPAGWGAMRRDARADAPERLVADACLRPIHETIEAHTASSPLHMIGASREGEMRIEPRARGRARHVLRARVCRYAASRLARSPPARRWRVRRRPAHHTSIIVTSVATNE